MRILFAHNSGRYGDTLIVSIFRASRNSRYTRATFAQALSCFRVSCPDGVPMVLNLLSFLSRASFPCNILDFKCV